MFVDLICKVRVDAQDFSYVVMIDPVRQWKELRCLSLLKLALFQVSILFLVSLFQIFRFQIQFVVHRRKKFGEPPKCGELVQMHLTASHCAVSSK